MHESQLFCSCSWGLCPQNVEVSWCYKKELTPEEQQSIIKWIHFNRVVIPSGAVQRAKDNRLYWSNTKKKNFSKDARKISPKNLKQSCCSFNRLSFDYMTRCSESSWEADDSMIVGFVICGQNVLCQLKDTYWKCFFFPQQVNNHSQKAEWKNTEIGK